MKQLVNTDCGVTFKEVKLDLVEKQDVRTEERWLRIVNSDTSRKGNGFN